MRPPDSAWVCVQLGAREHYAVPRALHAAAIPCFLVTDTWVAPSNTLGPLKRNLQERFHAQLASIPVDSWNARSIAFELRARLVGLRGWPLGIARNKWFQGRVVFA